jgi:putative ABC transport system permease protein
MRALDRKLLRDLWQMRGQALAISLVIACGIATFVMSLNTLGSLQHTQEAYYERYRFADVFSHLRRAPEPVAARIAEIPGVAQVQTRVVEQVTLDVPGFKEPAIGRLISIPERRAPGLNDLHLRRGRYIEPGRDGEVLVSEGFAEAHALEPGDSLRAIINGRLRRLRIVGVALSPEYIYQIQPGDILPDDRRFGVFWMGQTELAAAFDMQGAFNDVSLTLAPGANEAEVIRRLDQLLALYGGLGAYGRADQPSHEFVTNELRELRGMALFLPTIFLAVAAFLLHVVITRLVGTQREQIAALKAFGYSKAEVGRHYLKLVLTITAVGVVLGTIVGARLGRSVTELYTRFFRFPVFEFHLDPSVVALALVISCGAAIVGTVTAVLRAVRLPPAEAMRPEPPANYRPTLIERLGLQRLLTPPVRMILRHLERQPVRTTLAIVGIATAVAVLILGNFTVDSLDYVMESQFEVAQRQDVTVGFVEAASRRALFDVAHLPGVRAAEPFRSLPVRMRFGHRTRRLGIMGLQQEARLYRLMDIERNKVPLPREGVVLSAKLAEVLGVAVGDFVTLEVLEGRRPIRRVQVAALVRDFSGISAYMDLTAVNRLMEEGDLVSGAHLAVDPARLNALYAELKQTPRVASVIIKRAALESFRQTIAENLMTMRLFNVIFASIIAFGVVYNSARIALSERSRELATLRVIGFRRSEISMILLGELAVVTLAAIPIGLVLGYALAAFVIEVGFDSELFRIPLIVSRSTYGFAASVTVLAALVSGLIVRRRLDQLDLVAVLKSRE